jgi:alkanesulfonate monooxygenase SsuD/methylene tetrahydromethanopterin reductase-like flavin-dependent oxidoreductase (luciferase family)
VRVSVELLPDASAAEVLAAIHVADASSIDTVFCVDEIYHRDAWALLAAAARETTRVRLGPGVAHVMLRDPLLVAQQLATLDELSGGRAVAAFSVGNLAMLEQFGRDPAGVRPAPRLREAHAAMRALLDDGSVDAVGEFGAYAGVFTMARPVAERVPLLLGAMGGPLTFRIAGEVADGVYCACSFSREALGYVVDNVRVGAERAGRRLEVARPLRLADRRRGRRPRGRAARGPAQGGVLPAVDARRPDRAARRPVHRDRADQRGVLPR